MHLMWCQKTLEVTAGGFTMSILEFSMLVIFSVHLAEWCIKPVDTRGDATFFFYY